VKTASVYLAKDYLLGNRQPWVWVRLPVK